MNTQQPIVENVNVTRQMAEWIAGFDGDVPEARIWAQHVLLDWICVTIPGAVEDAAQIVTQAYSASGPCSLIGAKGARSAEDAALINGTAGHVLDYDDGSIMFNGHATAPVAPALLALAEELGSTGAEVITAMIVGQEVETQLSQMMTPDHYQVGYHATATLGTIGAAAASARLFGLNADQSAHALGLAATQAAGLKSMFGSMAKSFQVGKAAQNGIIAARLAQAGFTANPDGLEAAQGIGPVMSTSFAPKPFAPGGLDRWCIAFNAFKYHGACFMTHSAIEAARQMGKETGIGPGDVDSMTIDVMPAVLTVCDNPEPETGLESKFAIRHLAMAGLRGDETSDVDCYTDAFAQDAELAAARRKVVLNTPPENAAMLMAARISVTTTDGQVHMSEADVVVPASDLDAQWENLSAKARSLLPAAQADALITAIDALDTAPSVSALMAACGKSST